MVNSHRFIRTTNSPFSHSPRAGRVDTGNNEPSDVVRRPWVFYEECRWEGGDHKSKVVGDWGFYYLRL